LITIKISRGYFPVHFPPFVTFFPYSESPSLPFARLQTRMYSKYPKPENPILTVELSNPKGFPCHLNSAPPPLARQHLIAPGQKMLLLLLLLRHHHQPRRCRAPRAPQNRFERLQMGMHGMMPHPYKVGGVK
jgi:hypothetical protein